MRKINKKAEPKEWTAYRLTPGVDYEAIPELRQSLLEEQGYICAYCMRRIPVRDTNSNEITRIDHILSRENHPELKLNYANMAICCPGAIDSDFHCDKLKEDNDVTFDIYSDHFFTTLSYGSKTGEISCSNPTHCNEINIILNLNNGLLKANRHSVLNGVIQYLNKKGWTVANIKSQLANWENLNRAGQYKPYCGIVVWYLQKRLRRK